MIDMRFSSRNKARSESPKGFNHKLSDWSLSDWLTATAGELGEAANVIKKLNRIRDGTRGNPHDSTEYERELREQLADELADTVIYLDLLAQAAGLDLETIRDNKFEKTNKKIGYDETALWFEQQERERRLKSEIEAPHKGE